jgi:hypothetical protein
MRPNGSGACRHQAKAIGGPYQPARPFFRFAAYAAKFEMWGGRKLLRIFQNLSSCRHDGASRPAQKHNISSFEGAMIRTIAGICGVEVTASADLEKAVTLSTLRS